MNAKKSCLPLSTLSVIVILLSGWTLGVKSFNTEPAQPANLDEVVVIAPSFPVVIEDQEEVDQRELHSFGDIPLRLKFPNGFKDITVNQGFVDFLTSPANSSLKTLKHQGGDCYRRCEDTLYYIQDIFYQYNIRSLYEFFYVMTMADGCFCHNSNNYYYDEGDEWNDSEYGFELNINFGFKRRSDADLEEVQEGPEVSQEVEKLMQRHNGPGNKNYNNDNGRHCQWNNAIHWTIRLIQCGYRNFRYSDVSVRDACRYCICRNY